jgi:tetratricopeptide (TPR) repeat protein
MKAAELYLEISTNLKKLNSNISPGQNFGRLHGNISCYYKNGLFYLDLIDFEAARDSFQKSAYINLMLHDIRFSEKYINLKKYESPYLSGVNWEPFHTVINCGNEEFLQKFFENLQVLPKEDKNGYNVIAIMLKKGLITNNQALIEKHATKLRKKKVENQRGYEKGEMICLLGILESDLNQINEGINFLIKTFIRDQKGNRIISSIALWATAMVRLARRLGFEPDISNSYISKELVFMENTTFEPNEELKSYEKQLKEINTPGWVYDEKKDKMSEWTIKQIEDAKKDEKKGFFGKLFG